MQVYESTVAYAGDDQREISIFKATFPAVDGTPGVLVGTMLDISERKRTEAYREIGREVLQILNKPGEFPSITLKVLAALRAGTGFSAVGIRLVEGEDFPYYAQEGFTPEFLLTENTLADSDREGGACRDGNGMVHLGCTCGMVISGAGGLLELLDMSLKSDPNFQCGAKLVNK